MRVESETSSSCTGPSPRCGGCTIRRRSHDQDSLLRDVGAAWTKSTTPTPGGGSSGRFMANPDPAKDIDRIFADGALVDEAVQTASHVAVDADRRAGRSLVVFRDGRIDHVSPDELHKRLDNPEVAEALLIETEFSVPRTAREFTLWVEDRCQAIADAPALKRAGLLHETLFK